MKLLLYSSLLTPILSFQLIADEIHWYGVSEVTSLGSNEVFPLDIGDTVYWSLRLQVEDIDDESLFTNSTKAELSLAANQHLWRIGSTQNKCAEISLRDNQYSDLINVRFLNESTTFIGQGAETLEWCTFRVHGPGSMLGSRKLETLKTAQFDWRSSKFRPFIALGCGAKDCIWLSLDKLRRDENNNSKGSYSPSIRVSTKTNNITSGDSIHLEFTVNQSHFAQGTQPIVERSEDLVTWSALGKEWIAHDILDNDNGTETWKYEITTHESAQLTARSFFRIRPSK